MRACPVALLAAASLGLAGCAAGAGGAPIGDAAALPIVRAAQSSLGAAPARTRARVAKAPARRRRAVNHPTRRPAVAPGALTGEPTPPGPRRPRAATAALALPVAEAARLAAPACAQYAAALAGRFPDAVRARGAGRAPAIVTESVAAALHGLPLRPPVASLPAREALYRAHEKLAAHDDDAAAATRRWIGRYARAIGIAGCG
jgi:hypothetical protein